MQHYGMPPAQEQQPQQAYQMFTGFSPIQSQVWNIFKECNSAEGLNVQSVIRRLSGAFPEPQLK